MQTVSPNPTAQPRTDSRRRLYWLIGALVVMVTVFKVQLSAPVITPDSKLFATFADNLRLNGCLSDSEPAGKQCTPAWGSQPPGYPLFLATLRTVNESPKLVVVMQVVLFSAAALWLALALPFRNPAELIVRVLVLTASPLTLAWGRWVLTETLAIATSMFVFGIIARALHTKRISLALLCAALVMAMLLRWDQIWLLMPALATLALVYPFRTAVRKGAIVLAVTALPWAALSTRALAQGLTATPQNTVDLDMPPGILHFWRTTGLDQRATAQLIWPAWSRDYARVVELDPAAIDESVDRAALQPLLGRLAATPAGAAFPLPLDPEFQSLAQRAKRDEPVKVNVGVPLVRAARLWFSPERLFYSGWAELAQGNDGAERWRTGYRAALVLLTIIGLLAWFDPELRRFATLVAIYTLARTCFLVLPQLTMLEGRYLTESFPLMELIAVHLLFGFAFAARRARLTVAHP